MLALCGVRMHVHTWTPVDGLAQRRDRWNDSDESIDAQIHQIWMFRAGTSGKAYGSALT